MTNITERSIAKALEQLRQNARSIDEQAEALEKQLRAARGTRGNERLDKRDLTAKAATAVSIAEAAVGGSLTVRIEQALRREFLSPAKLAERVGALETSVRAAVTRASGKIVNVGTAEKPAWSWVVGDAGPTPELNALVVRLLEHRPMTSAELVAFTGAREKRISGAIVKIQQRAETAPRLKNLGNGARAIWSLR